MSVSEEQMEIDLEALRGMVDKLQAELLNCKHPGCACVCGHQGTCPEDGPSIIEGIED